MASMWPFSGGGRIQDLKAPALAEAALKSIQKSGRTSYSLRLIYRILELDPYNSYALMVLMESFRGSKKGIRPTGDEVYAGLVLEYALNQKSSISPEQRRFFEKARQDLMTSWGFVTTHGADVEVDHLGYASFINEAIVSVGSAANGFLTAVAKIGLRAGLVDSAKKSTTPAYHEWLRSDAATLSR